MRGWPARAKVPPWIAKVRRHPGRGAYLPAAAPRHLLHQDLTADQRCEDSQPEERIHVKLVFEFGVGTIAAGVAKCHADVVLISGYDGGTGAAPLNAIKHAGTPWEIGLSKPSRR